MGLFDILTNKNFQAFALKHYDDPQCEDVADFQEDLRRIRYLKRLLFRHHEYGEIRERLMLNHLICLFNVFGYDACMRMLQFKIQEDAYWSSIKTMLLYMGYVGEDFYPSLKVDEVLNERLKDI